MNSPRRARLRTHALLLGPLLLLPFAALWRVFLRGETLWIEDVAGIWFPRERLLLREGFPGWNSHVLLGIGLAGDPHTAAHEPVRALCRLLGVHDTLSLALYIAVWLAVASVGVYALSLRKGALPVGAALAVLAFVWGGALVVRFRHPQLLPSLCLLPWMLLLLDRLLERRRLADALALGAVQALGALGGQPQASYMAWLLIAFVALLGIAALQPGERLRGLRDLALLLVAAGTTSLVLLAFNYGPVLPQLLGSVRREWASVQSAGAFSWLPYGFVRLLAPDIFGNDLAGTYYGPDNYHEHSVYLGVAPLLLLLLSLAWRPQPLPVRALLWVALASLALALGRFFPAFYIACALVPGFKLFRCSVRYLWFFALAGALVSGLVLSRLARGERPEAPLRTARLLRALWLPLCALALLVAAAAPLLLRLGGEETPGAAETVRLAALHAALCLGATGLVLEAWLRARLAGPRAAALLLALTALDLAAQWGPYRQTRPPAQVFPAPDIEAALREAAPGRVLVHAYRPDGGAQVVPLLNWGEAGGWDGLRGYNQGVREDVFQLLRAGDLSGAAASSAADLIAVDPAEWLLDLTGVRRIVAREGEWPARFAALPLRASGGGWEVRERQGALPRAWLVSAALPLPGPAALLRLPSLDLRAVATVDADAGLPSAPSGPAGEVQLAAGSADRVSLDVRARVPALLVLADHFDAGWTATVDGAPRPILRADFLLRGVRVERGAHRVEFAYRAPGAAAGRLVTLLGLPLLLLALAFDLRRRRPAR